MYNYIDTDEVSGSNGLPAEAVSFNGVWLDEAVPGFRTLYVRGRESIEGEIRSIANEYGDGERFKRRRYLPRHLIIGYQLLEDTPEEFMAAVNLLNKLLAPEESRIIFNDEPDKFYVGTKTVLDKIDPGRVKVTSEIEITCSDPFKYSLTETELTAGEEGTVSVDYAGIYPARPVIEATMTGDNGFVSALLQKPAGTAYLQFGNVDEEDTQPTQISEVLLDDSMSKTGFSGYTLNSGYALASDNVQAGTVNYVSSSSQEEQVVSWGGQTFTIPASTVEGYVTPSSYGSGSKWHGPALTKVIPTDSSGGTAHKSFTAEFNHRFWCSAYDCRAIHQVRVLDEDYANLMTVQFCKNSTTSWETSITLYIGPDKKKVKTITYNDDAYGGNKYVNPGVTSLSKYGSTFKFNLNGETYTFTDSSLENKKAKAVQVYMAKYGSEAIGHMQQLYTVRFTSHSVDSEEDIPNLFMADDILVADTKDGTVKVNGAEKIGIGSIGNDWEGFRLMPGTNSIAFGCSQWAERPEYKLRYREVFL